MSIRIKKTKEVTPNKIELFNDAILKREGISL